MRWRKHLRAILPAVLLMIGLLLPFVLIPVIFIAEAPVWVDVLILLVLITWMLLDRFEIYFQSPRRR